MYTLLGPEPTLMSCDVPDRAGVSCQKVQLKKERLIEVMQFHVVLSVFSLYSGFWRLGDLITVPEVSVTASDGGSYMLSSRQPLVTEDQQVGI